MNADSDLNYFPKSYEDSRQRFCNSVTPNEKRGSWHVPTKLKDYDFTVDHAYWPALEEDATLLVLTSGVHGAEAYAGSALQNLFVKEFLPHLDRRRFAVFMVHALNPYGFQFHRRHTENKVNLNRNFLVSPESFHQSPKDLVTSYNEMFLERAPVSGLASKILKMIRFEQGKVLCGEIPLDQAIKVMAPGQYWSPEDMEFGGFGVEPQSAFFIEHLNSLMKKFKNVIGLDVHTGLGEKNRLHMLASGHVTPMSATLFNDLYNPQLDHEIYAFTPAQEKGFYATQGSLSGLFGQLADPQQRVCAMTMEFGTLGNELDQQLASLNTMVLELQGASYGYANSQLEKEIQAQLLNCSFPQDEIWQRNLVAKSRTFLKRILARAICL